MIGRVVFAALLLAACGKVEQRVDSQGQAARAEVDKLTVDYANCISGHAEAMPLGNDPAGTVVDAIVRTCAGTRTALVAKVAAFDRLGHPKHAPNQAEAVAEASVADIEDELRADAVVTIVKRQTATTKGTKI